MRHKLRPNVFKKHRPEYQVQRYFGNLRMIIISAQSKSPMQPEDWREGTGDKPEVIEIPVKETVACMRLQQPAIDCVGYAADEKKRITTISESLHIKGRSEEHTSELQSRGLISYAG